MPHPHYLVLNTEGHSGRILIIGDVHGQNETFQAVLETLRADDTLIIVGDLADRGEIDPDTPTSTSILDTMIAYQADASKPRILAVKGNHELDFLTLMRFCRDLRQAKLNPALQPIIDGFIASTRDKFIEYLGNGGAWILKRDTQEQQAIFAWGRYYSTDRQGPSGPVALSKLNLLVSKILTQNQDPFDFLIPQLTTYENYIQTLPFVIKIENDDNPAWIVHSDCPFTDVEMDTKIAEGIDLTTAEISHLTCARPRQFSDCREPTSTLVYSGHNIIDEPDQCQHKMFPALPVRENSNTVNLDVGAYYNKGFVCVNHLERSVSVITAPGVTEESLLFLQAAADDIDIHMNFRPNSTKRLLG